jgi:hypothetical protein
MKTCNYNSIHKKPGFFYKCKIKFLVNISLTQNSYSLTIVILIIKPQISNNKGKNVKRMNYLDNWYLEAMSIRTNNSSETMEIDFQTQLQNKEN